MKTFDELWREITKRPGVITVQNREELEHVFNLLQSCESYLEVGTAEGNSLFVLAQALGGNSDYKIVPRIAYVDYGEKHTQGPRDEIIRALKDAHINIFAILGNSHHMQSIREANCFSPIDYVDAVLIDAGHTYEDVIADAAAYGWMAKKCIIFHDVQLPEVCRAYDWYRKQMPEKESYRVVNSETFGYGIIKI